MKLKEVKKGILKDLTIYGLTQEDQSIEFILTEAEKEVKRNYNNN